MTNIVNEGDKLSVVSVNTKASPLEKCSGGKYEKYTRTNKHANCLRLLSQKGAGTPTAAVMAGYGVAYFFLIGTFFKVHACTSLSCFRWVRFLGVVFWGVMFDMRRSMSLVSYCDLYERNYTWRKTFVQCFFLFYVDCLIEKQR